jgi:hypothetical protein
MAKNNMAIPVTKFSQEEIIAAVMSECEDFSLIPRAEQWTMALYSIGHTQAVIANETGRSPEAIAQSIERYGKFTSSIPDGIKSQVNQRMIWNSIGSYISVISDHKKVEALKPDAAAKIVKELPNILRELMKIEAEYFEHKSRMDALNFDKFGKSLGQ